MAPIDSLPPELLSRIFTLGSSQLRGGTHESQVRANYLQSCSLVNKAFRAQAQRLLFARAFFFDLDTVARFARAVQESGREKRDVKEVVMVLPDKKDVGKWKDALKTFLAEFPGVVKVTLEGGRAQAKIDLEEWLGEVSTRLTHLRFHHFALQSIPTTSSTLFPSLIHLDMEGCTLPNLVSKSHKPFFSLFPSLRRLQWICIVAPAARLKTAFEPLYTSLTSLQLQTAHSIEDNTASVEIYGKILSSFTSLVYLDVSLDLLHARPTLSPTIAHLVLHRMTKQPWSDNYFTFPEIADITEILSPPAFAPRFLDGNYFWYREAKRGEAEKASLLAFRELCASKEIKLYIEEGGIDDDNFMETFEKLKIPPGKVEDGFELSEEEERKLSKKEALDYYRKVLQRTFLDGEEVVDDQETLNKCGLIIQWLSGYHLGDYTLESFVGFTLRKIGALPADRIPEWAEEKWDYRAQARAIHREIGDMTEEDGPKPFSFSFGR
ncbi:hypothetical protein MNV49_003425 [Pseudohyphozyma bogoriensis]|nr:hypothetical protein MNV49_003425 [Pseudohyphozyma bogoriensis]